MAGCVECSCFGSFLCFLGSVTLLYYLLKWSWRIWQGFKVYVLSSIWQTDVREYGQWAVVTGSTAGIGRAYALERATKVINCNILSVTQHVALEIFFPGWLRLSPFGVRRIERFAQEKKKQIEERIAQCQRKQE
ncbi:Very-long-chain 3-oxoacyl-CoA reductase [Bagarius yarrelli]|uniref:Very-long-chain 3-oxoacyl-CoA reductase n=1 Tax=Bagarius yarrelli TaxID=175774 RepID=A0A556VU51_BAGYA|nr:Very-long-chain 3-oxoacyl-CoA reductase [Bagarius yarrelli]